MQSFWIYLNLYYQVKMDCYNEDVLSNPHGNHKTKTYNKCTKDKKKGI